MTEQRLSTPEKTVDDGQQTGTHGELSDEQRLAGEHARREKPDRKAVKRYRREVQLRPYQAELIKMQQHLEK